MTPLHYALALAGALIAAIPLVLIGYSVMAMLNQWPTISGKLKKADVLTASLIGFFVGLILGLVVGVLFSHWWFPTVGASACLSIP